MENRTLPAYYHSSPFKATLDFLLSLAGLSLLFPVILLISITIKLTSKGPVYFRQRRIGVNGRIFKLIKFRTMRVGAEREQSSLSKLNQADGPVFKILDDPRYTKIGRFLGHTGLDELPQLINVLKGEMSLVGPRPLPTYEASKLTKAQKIREKVLPGITSNWVVSGSHRLSFKEWMELDKDYVENANLFLDLQILLKTAYMMARQIAKHFLKLFNFYNPA